MLEENRSPEYSQSLENIQAFKSSQVSDNGQSGDKAQRREKVSQGRLIALKEKLLELDVKYTFRLRVAEKPGIKRRLAILFAHSGDSWFWLLGLGLVWFYGSAFWKERAGAMAISVLITAVLVLSIKFLVRRERPVGEWGEIYRKTDPHSFPSGHAARATLLSLLALGLGPLWLGLLLLAWAPLVILARVAMGVHYLSDVLAGAGLGILIGFLLLELIPRLPFLV
jgi:undecaprenyl-diphosphatase